MQSKTYIQTSRSYTSPSKGNLGWKEVPMPKIIQPRPSSNEDVSSEKYQKNDYLTKVSHPQTVGLK